MLQTIKNFYHLLQATIANIYYGLPSQKLKVIGVTGTDGKTTTTHLIYHILKYAGKKVSMVSSVYANIGGEIYETGFHVTTPDIFPLYRFLRQSVDAGDEYFVLETTSHALAQNRVYGIRYEAAVLTNVTHEHLDFHKNYLLYIKSKLVLFQNAHKILINIDDKSYSFFKELLSKNYHTYGLKNKADYQLDIGKELKLKITKFNIYNYLAAYAMCDILGIEKREILAALPSFELPVGRLEVVTKKPVITIIDFAHTPNALHHVLSEIKENFVLAKNQLIHVFGAAGLRDDSKRTMMGEESGTYADVTIVTEEDYRTEDPQKIADQIAEGLKRKAFHLAESNMSNLSNKSYMILLDRKKAVEKAVEISKQGDVIVLTGKSHEKSLCRGKIEYPWDEKKALVDALIKFKLQ